MTKPDSPNNSPASSSSQPLNSALFTSHTNNTSSSSQGIVAAIGVDAIAIDAIDVAPIGVAGRGSASSDVPHVDDECDVVYSYSPSNATLPHCLYMTWQEFQQKEYGVLDGFALSHDQLISLQLEVKKLKELTSEGQDEQEKIYHEFTTVYRLHDSFLVQSCVF